MPKETVYCNLGSDDFVVTVGWRPGREQAGGDVQVATEMLGAPEEAAARFREIADLITADTIPGWGLYATLDRNAVNQLIRLLRKARDSAYGADA